MAKMGKKKKVTPQNKRKEAAAQKRKKVVTQKSARASKAKRPPATEREIKTLNERAGKVRALDEAIVKADRASMGDALKAGDHIIWGKQELKRVNAKMGFKKWIEDVCKIPYKRGYNYKRVAEAAAENPAIKELGLTEAYVLLGLVTRKKVSAAHGITTGGGGEDTSDDNDGEVDEDTDKLAEEKTDKAATVNPVTDESVAQAEETREPVTRRIGKFDVAREKNYYVLEIPEIPDADILRDVFSDTANLNAVLKDGGLLIRIKVDPTVTDSAEGEANV